MSKIAVTEVWRQKIPQIQLEISRLTIEEALPDPCRDFMIIKLSPQEAETLANNLKIALEEYEISTRGRHD